MTTETIIDPIEKEDKHSVFIPDPSPKRLHVKKHDGETQEEFMARQEGLDAAADAVRQSKH